MEKQSFPQIAHSPISSNVYGKHWRLAQLGSVPINKSCSGWVCVAVTVNITEEWVSGAASTLLHEHLFPNCPWQALSKVLRRDALNIGTAVLRVPPPHPGAGTLISSSAIRFCLHHLKEGSWEQLLEPLAWLQGYSPGLWIGVEQNYELSKYMVSKGRRCRFESQLYHLTTYQPQWS